MSDIYWRCFADRRSIGAHCGVENRLDAMTCRACGTARPAERTALPPSVSREQLLALLDDYHLARVDRECCGDEFQQQYVAAIDSILAALRAPAEQAQTTATRSECPRCNGRGTITRMDRSGLEQEIDCNHPWHVIHRASETKESST